VEQVAELHDPPAGFPPAAIVDRADPVQQGLEGARSRVNISDDQLTATHKPAKALQATPFADVKIL
jgi:hypothetical protein